MLYRISKNKNRMNKLILNENSEWTKETQKIIDKYEINKQIYLNMKPRKAKKFIRRRIQLIFRKELFENRDNKSKVDYLTKQYIGNEKAEYTNYLNRRDTSIMFKARCRMLDIKGNYKNKYPNMICRLCKNETETQEHILNKCNITLGKDLRIDIEMLHTRSHRIMNKIVDKIKEIEKLLKGNGG